MCGGLISSQPSGQPAPPRLCGLRMRVVGIGGLESGGRVYIGGPLVCLCMCRVRLPGNASRIDSLIPVPPKKSGAKA